MDKLSNIFEEHKNNIVDFIIDDVRKSAYQQGRADERKELKMILNDCESCTIHHVDNVQEAYQRGRAE